MDVNTSGVLYNQQLAGYKAALEPSVGEQARFPGFNRLRANNRVFEPVFTLHNTLTNDCLHQMASSEEFLQHFGLRLAQLIAPATPIQTVQQAITQTLAEATAISNGTAVPPQQANNEERQLELVFVHDCR